MEGSTARKRRETQSRTKGEPASRKMFTVARPIARPPRNARGVVRVIARKGGGGQTNMTERAYGGAEPSRAERVAHGERNAAEGCIDPPAARSRRRRALSPSPFCPSAVPLPTPNDSLVSLRERKPLWFPLSFSSFLSISLVRSSSRSIPLFHPSLTCLAYTPAAPFSAHVDHAARGDISEPG